MLLVIVKLTNVATYLHRIVGMFGGEKFGKLYLGELSAIHQTKTIQISSYN